MAGCHGSVMEGFLTTLPPFSQFITPQGLDYLELCRATLSLGGPGALRWANTQECGVQVNAKVDKTVQCSLGPKTLLGPETLLGLARERPGASKLAQSPCPELGTARQYETPPRFLRRVSLYPPFLEQRYGFLHCKTCSIWWESAYVWCSSGTCKVYYKQLCRRCQAGLNPYRVEPIICKDCSLTSCSCVGKHRHININGLHRQELCSRCKGTRLSCDSTHSFKYTF
ncbi:unnamed protein product [Pleuronectes platessa]|uniref:3CxxC-type domain-containing protein n=1 Tax=Pleuronectes platessa TaxID=8262 RepID=A0A9N7W1E4_PLEPL|nr:unnamed protein product [Pleuronectes platessa]